MEVKLGYSVIGNPIRYIKLSYKRGLKYFSEQDYIQCNNAMYLQKDGEYVHFNKKCKMWIFD